MNTLLRKSKMISFRVSHDEYSKMCDACQLQGVESISELARLAVQSLLGLNAPPPAVDRQLTDLQDRVRTLSSEFDRLAQFVYQQPPAVPQPEMNRE